MTPRQQSTQLNHDVFIIYTQGDPHEARLCEEIKDALLPLGLTAPGYEEMEWLLDPEPGAWRSYGSNADPARLMIGDPNPFWHPGNEQPVNKEMLIQWFEKARAVVLIAPRAVTPTEGVLKELEALHEAYAPPVVGVSWHNENERYIRDADAFFSYKIPYRIHQSADDWQRHARNVCGLIWIARLIVTLYEEYPSAGTLLLRAVALGCEPIAEAVVRNQRMNAPYRSAVSAHWRRAGAAPKPIDVKAVLREARPDSAAGVWKFWRGGAGVLSRNIESRVRDRTVVPILEVLSRTLDSFCDVLEESPPESAVLDASNLAALGDAEYRVSKYARAVECYDAALALKPEPSLHAAILARRATARGACGDSVGALADYDAVADSASSTAEGRACALVARGRLKADLRRFEGAIEDFDRVLEMKSAPFPASFSALLERADIRLKYLDEYARAAEDYTRFIDDPAAPRRYRARAHLHRGVAHFKQKQWSAAIHDWDAVLDIREASQRQRESALLNRCDAKTVSGDHQGAKADLDALLRLPDLSPRIRLQVERRLQPGA